MVQRQRLGADVTDLKKLDELIATVMEQRRMFANRSMETCRYIEDRLEILRAQRVALFEKLEKGGSYV